MNGASENSKTYGSIQTGLTGVYPAINLTYISVEPPSPVPQKRPVRLLLLPHRHRRFNRKCLPAHSHRRNPYPRYRTRICT